jgi:undecaprenyl-diphosphatase
MINPVDTNIIHFLNQFAQRSTFFDRFVNLISDNLLFQGAPLMFMLWWAWFRKREDFARDRGFVVSGIVLSTAALVVNRVLSRTLPFRVRPRFDPTLHFHMPAIPPGFNLIDWSSFPSDHAVMYFSLATCLFFISRKLGVLAFLHAFFIGCLPLIYLGVHFPTDIFAGALVGIGIASLSLSNVLSKFIKEPCRQWMENSSRSFYPCLNLCTLLMATKFDPVKSVVVAAWKAL